MLCFIRNKLQEDDTLVECFEWEVDAIMELLEVCLKTTYKLIINSSNKRRVQLWGGVCSGKQHLYRTFSETSAGHGRTQSIIVA